MEWPSGIVVTDELEQARVAVERGDPFIFITGAAGTGKSTLVHCLRSMMRRRFAVVAPTGVAALNAGGQTIHSFFRFRAGPIALGSIGRSRQRRLFQKLEVLIIDEISMVRADLLDGIEKFLRLNGPDGRRPFGGVQVVAIGDLSQLPPVVSDPEEARLFSEWYETEYFFSAHALSGLPVTTIELSTVYRQTDPAFVALLHDLRHGRNVEASVAEINARCHRPSEAAAGIVLTATNAVADRINNGAMSRLSGEAVLYQAEIEGEFDIRRHPPAPSELWLKPGAHVMFTKNDAFKRWVNGTRGIVKDLEPLAAWVEIDTGTGPETLLVERAAWESVRYAYDEAEGAIRTDVVGAYRQLPLVPAWAITIHKSQGKTLDNVIVDLGSGAFAFGQTYVALSRCRSLEQVRLARPLRASDVRFDPRIARVRALGAATPLDFAFDPDPA